MQEDISQDDPVTFDDPLSNFEQVDYESPLHQALAEDLADTIESQPYVQVEPSTTIRQAIQALHKSGVSSLLVVQEGELIGIFTERDVLEKVAEQYSKMADREVSEVMTINPTVVYETDPAAAALAAIAVAGHRHVPVLKVDRSVLGIVSPRRVFDFVARHDEA